MIDWKIQARSHVCQACEKSFADKQPYFTLLFDRKHGLERLDVCGECWESQYSQGAHDRKDFVSFWQGIFTVPPPAPPEPIQKETAETLLGKLIDRNDPNLAAAGFILAVMLERKRILKVKAQTTQDGARVFVYEHVRTGDLFTVVDPSLQLDQLEAVQIQVAHLLEHGLEGPDEEKSAPLAVEAKSDSDCAPPGALAAQETIPASTGAGDAGVTDGAIARSE
ncbi:MAG: hypothetical protein M1608_03965 [Candidatus Omnitrophica bacterium]|nr:hypothetical protein [Candidatus Omnitrophota bacterium]